VSTSKTRLTGKEFIPGKMGRSTTESGFKV
jgi:hypothetical protein